MEKQPLLPADIEWHLVGHLQRNKVKHIASFVSLVHAVDSFRLLEEIDKQGGKCSRIIPCLLQVYIATEETKFGMDAEEVRSLIRAGNVEKLRHVRIDGLMGMASLTADTSQVQAEFHGLKIFFDELKASSLPPNIGMKELSMGMSGDFEIALKEGSTLVRIGTAVFGERKPNLG